MERLKCVALLVRNTALLLPFSELLTDAADHSVDVVQLEHFTTTYLFFQLTSTTHPHTAEEG